MAWTVTDWTTNPDWHAVGTVNDFRKAATERALAVGSLSQPGDKNVGDDVQAATVWSGLQQWIIDHYAYFVVSHDAGIKRGAAYYNDKTTIDKYATLAAVFSAAGFAHSNFRRYTTHPDAAGGVAYGKMVAGDIIGPWIFEDLQDCLNVLIWTLAGANAVGEAGVTNYKWGSGSGANYAAALANVQAAYDGNSSQNEGGGPWAWTRVRKSSADGSVSFNPAGAAGMLRGKAKFEITGLYAGCKRDIDWYVDSPALGVRETFDANGDDVIDDKFSFWVTLAANQDADPISVAYFGSLVYPNASEPPADDLEYRRGYGRVASWGLVRWDVADGFVYT